jgi:DNA ligase 1
MHLASLVEVSERVGRTSRRKEKAELIADFMRRVRGGEIALAASYLAGRLRQGRIGIGWNLIERARHDLGSVSEPLHLNELNDRLQAMSEEGGAGSTERKIRGLREILSRCEERERVFIISLIMGELRQGAMEGMVLEGLALASSLSREALRQALMFSGDLGEVARAALEEGVNGLARFGPVLFRPISPMLASPVEGEREAALRLGEAGWEYKIDGARVQIHKSGERVVVFSRNLLDVTRSVPEVADFAGRLPMESAILEGEVIALAPDGAPLPFQTTMRRFGRIKGVSRTRGEIPLTLFLFDLLYLDGEPLFETAYGERVEALSRRASAHLIPRIVTADIIAAGDFLKESLRKGHEGLMAKKLDAPYRAGQRGFLWLKIKQAQTLDLVILAAEWGHGRRQGRLSNLHLGARDTLGGGFVMLGKTFKGLTDEMLRWQTGKLLSLEIARDASTVYVRPELVVEVAFSDIQESPRYPGGLTLRFARVKGFRPDKTVREADTLETVGRLLKP